MPKITTNGTNAVRLQQDLAAPPTARYFPSLTIQYNPDNSDKIYVGLPRETGGVEGAVSSTNFDAVLDGATRSVTAGGEPNTRIDACRVWIKPAVADEGGSWFGGVAS